MRLTAIAGAAAMSREADLVAEHTSLVHYLVTEVAGRLPRHVSRDDLVSAGMAGLADAARRFDDDRGTAFAPFAARRIRGAILDELRSMDWAPRRVRFSARLVEGARAELAASLGRAPTPEELAAHTGMARAEMDVLADDVQRAVVLQYDQIAPSARDAVLPPFTTTPEQELLEQEQRGCLLDAVAALPDRLRTVVIGYFFNERPMQEIADELGVTESRVSQMRAEAIALLRDGMHAQLEPEKLNDPAKGRVARRKAAYYAAIAAQSTYRSRQSSDAMVGPDGPGLVVTI